MPPIQIENITKQFGEKKALDEISLTIKERSFTCILGPPGAGKTTLLRILAGLESPDGGRIFIDEKEVTSWTPTQRGISFVSQLFVLYPHMKVYDNIAYPLKLKKIAKEERDRKIKKVVQFLKIAHLLDRAPSQLSGGEQQRVAIARALVKGAKVYLFDEPLTNLDYKIREDMRAELQRMQKRLGQTIVYAASDPVEVLAMSDNVVILDGGKVEQVGGTREVYNHPQTLFAATYFGYPRMNTFSAFLTRNDERVVLDAGSFSIDVTTLNERFLADITEYIIAVRPENILVAEDRFSAGIMLETKALLSEIIGSDTILHLEIPGLIESVRVFLPRAYPVSPGKKLWIRFASKDLFVFEKKSNKLVCQGKEIGPH